jgi:hypothetical protein
MLKRFLFFFSIFYSSLLFAEPDTIEISNLGSKDAPLILDLTKKSNLTTTTQKPGKVYLKIVNMLPSLKDSYFVSLDEKNVPVTPFTRPSNPAVALTADPICTSIDADITSILAAAQEDSVLSKLINRLRQSIKTAKALTANQCNPQLLINAKTTLDATQVNIVADLNANTEILLSVGRIGVDSTLGDAVFTAKPKEWMTHIGFTFLDNKSIQYYSKKVGNDYIISEQNTDSDILYAASILFTYPFYSNGDNSFGVGWSAGLGAASDTIQVTTGLSLIFAQNFVLNFGATAMQFDKLKGTYEEGQNIGQDSLDSSAMSDKQFDVGGSITLGYRFN